MSNYNNLVYMNPGPLDGYNKSAEIIDIEIDEALEALGPVCDPAWCADCKCNDTCEEREDV